MVSERPLWQEMCLNMPRGTPRPQFLEYIRPILAVKEVLPIKNVLTEESLLAAADNDQEFREKFHQACIDLR